MVILHVIFWMCLGGLVYIYAGYPALLWMFHRIRPRPVSVRATSDPTLSVVIAAYNEAPVLGAKVQSLLASTVAHRIAEILIASDASSDETGKVVRALADTDPRVRLLAFDRHRGKAACLNDAVPETTGAIVVLTDARQEVAPDALERLVRPFGDPTVGVVSGELVFRPEAEASATGRGMDAYWRYEKWIRGMESSIHSVPGATGALYAIRRGLFAPLPVDTLLDDVAIPMQAVCLQYRCVLEAGAIVYDRVSGSAEQENRRKRRTLTGCVQLARRHPRWWLPGGGCPIWWHFASHKLLRLLSPLFLAGAFVGSLLLREHGVYRAALAGQCGFYALAAVAWGLEKTGRAAGPLGICLLFVRLNRVILGALWDGLRGQYQVTWKGGS